MYLQKKLPSILLTIIILLCTQISNGQTNLSSDLKMLFGNLPMDLPAKKIIAAAVDNKNFKGQTHYNLDLSYSGIIMQNTFFKLSPDTCFIEIVSDATELFPDSALLNYSFFSFDAGFRNADTIAVKKEFDRIVKLFSLHFSSGRIEKENAMISFFNSKTEKIPTLTLYISHGDECYLGKRCIKLSYLKKST